MNDCGPYLAENAQVFMCTWRRVRGSFCVHVLCGFSSAQLIRMLRRSFGTPKFLHYQNPGRTHRWIGKFQTNRHAMRDLVLGCFRQPTHISQIFLNNEHAMNALALICCIAFQHIHWRMRTFMRHSESRRTAPFEADWCLDVVAAIH